MTDNIYAKRRKAAQTQVRRERLDRDQAEHAKTIARVAREVRDTTKRGGK